ncbi:MAG: aminotransferase class I/II-fold pyridoxal phosphate-dependent enzyme, partial [Dehalococcoidia bacterium]|nr:aminotransferase class I/II-fold pyridoxal phosphate-dependent enzyme [Dehalococcoidia bacterium]
NHYNIVLDDISRAVDNGARVMFLASPNNPSGNVTPEEDILSLLDRDIVLVVDEAYVEFSGTSLIREVPKRNNLIVLRTFSKWAGLAGLRVGYGIFPPNIARYIMKIKQPYNINCAAQVAALASLQDLQYLKDTINKIIEERKRLFGKLKELRFLSPYPSRANFILCRVVTGNARTIYEKLKSKGILVRYFDTPLLRDYLRISVGKPAHTDVLIKELKSIGEKGDE